MYFIIRCLMTLYAMACARLSLHDVIVGVPDRYGCVGSAGYWYCNYTDSCKRFSEPCNSIV